MNIENRPAGEAVVASERGTATDSPAAERGTATDSPAAERGTAPDSASARASAQPVTEAERARLRDALVSGRPVVAQRVVDAGLATRWAVATEFRRLFPGVVVAREADVTTSTLIRAAALWAPDDAVMCGASAARMSGERWFSQRLIRSRGVEVLTAGAPKTPEGVVLRRARRPLAAEDVAVVDGIRTTAPGRTALDLARSATTRDWAIELVDSMCNATGTPIAKVRAALDRMRGLHGTKRLRELLPDCDPGADSPPETRLRLAIVDGGLPRPETQVRIANEYGGHLATADLAYRTERIALFYDGRLHSRFDQWGFDTRANAALGELGWIVIRVTAEMLATPPAVVRQVRTALRRRGGDAPAPDWS